MVDKIDNNNAKAEVKYDTANYPKVMVVSVVLTCGKEILSVYLYLFTEELVNVRVYNKLCNWLSCDITIIQKGTGDDQKKI